MMPSQRRIFVTISLAHRIPTSSLIFLLFLINTLEAWHTCPTGGICPDGDKCCPTQVSGHSRCLSGKNISEGDCCTDDDLNTGVSTGCEAGFVCTIYSDDKKYGCNRTDSAEEGSPDRLPRYQLCDVPEEVLKQLYGLPVLQTNYVRESVQVPEIAYLSTIGAIDSKDPNVIELQEKVHTVVVMVHGSSRNVDDYICCTNSALPLEEQNPKNSTIMIVTPWFMSPDDPFTQFHGKDTTVLPLRWAEYGPIDHTWRYGADAINFNFSSYAAIDSIVNAFVRDSIRFASLQTIIVAGHSAGGQLTQRWSLLSNSNAFPRESFHPRVTTRVVVANPKGYCFLDNRRVDHDGNFKVPSPDAIDICPSFNEWEWGLGEGNDLPTPYKDEAISVAGGISTVVHRYATRDVVYLSGEMDVLLNGECEERLQGINRKERSEHFFQALKYYYGKPTHRRLVVPSVNHNHCLMFQSIEGRLALFGLPTTDLIDESPQ